MRKAFVFVAAFAAVLVAGAALALISVPQPEPAQAVAVRSTEPTSTTSTIKPGQATAGYIQVSEPSDDEPAPPAEPDPVEEKDTTPPELVILSPENGQHFEVEKIAFEGEVEPGAKVLAAGYEADVSDDGHWRIVLILSEGGNVATFTAVDASGNQTQAKVEVFFDVAEEKKTEDPPKEEPADHEFSARQKFGSCAEGIPYDLWYGTGKPGTQIWVGSQFGANSTVIGDNGKWELKVTFAEAPCNEQIEVVLETDRGHRKVFEFTRICEAPKDGHDDEGASEEGGDEK